MYLLLCPFDLVGCELTALEELCSAIHRKSKLKVVLPQIECLTKRILTGDYLIRTQLLRKK
jgi:hypothetical protein